MEAVFKCVIGLGAALDFASASWCWLVFHLVVTLKWAGAIGAGLLALAMCAVNRRRICAAVKKGATK